MCGSLDPRAASDPAPCDARLYGGALDAAPATPGRARSESPRFSPGPRRFRSPRRELDDSLRALDTNGVASAVAESRALVVDVRPFSSYNHARLASATSICVPSTLLKRQTFGLDRVLDFVPACDVPLVRDLSALEKVVFYDQNSTECALDSSISRTAAKLVGACPTLEGKLYFVCGGLDAVAREAPALVVRHERLSPAPSAPSAPKLVLSNIDLPAMTAEPARAHDDAPRIRVPPQAVTMLHRFPHWLASAITQSRDGRSVLAEGFAKLEQAEKRRTSSADTPTVLHAATLARTRSQSRQGETTPLRVRRASQGLFSPPHARLSPRLSPREVALLELPKLTPTSVKESPTTPLSDFSCGSSPLLVDSRDLRDHRGDPKDHDAQRRHAARRKHAFFVGNPRKNRYSNIMPYQFNRVVVRDGAYLNASYTHSQHSPLRYIATQAPVPASFSEFWWCVWEQRVPVIVMLTALVTVMGRVKGHVYWDTATYDGLHVEVVSESDEELGGVRGALKRRCIRLTLLGESRDVVQLHYDAWPDLGCPSNPADVLDLVELKNRYLRESPLCDESSYVVVHCSAGCGRTGTFCTVDTVVSHLSQLDWNAAVEERCDMIIEVASEFRDQRVSMVQTQNQLRLCYECVILYCMRRL